MPRSRTTHRPDRSTLLLTCEHGGNLVPAEFAHLFRDQSRLLDSHRGWDPGALELATHLATTLPAPLTAALVSRLVVDLNRSRDNPTLFSTATRELDEVQRQRILARLYAPYREGIEREIRSVVAAGRPLLHLSIHTFTPVLCGKRRDVDIGLLFDPGRAREAAFARAWKLALARLLPDLTIRFNQPYRGTDDGLTTHLRALFPDRQYAGLELEVNQRFPRRNGSAWQKIKAAVVQSVHELTSGVDRR